MNSLGRLAHCAYIPPRQVISTSWDHFSAIPSLGPHVFTYLVEWLLLKLSIFSSLIGGIIIIDGICLYTRLVSDSIPEPNGVTPMASWRWWYKLYIIRVPLTQERWLRVRNLDFGSLAQQTIIILSWLSLGVAPAQRRLSLRCKSKDNFVVQKFNCLIITYA